MTSELNRTRLDRCRRIVIKIGSSLLVDPDRGTVHRKWLESLAADISAARALGQEVVIVSSGAIAVGRRHLGLMTGLLPLEQKQAAAATGMIHLAHAYQEVLGHQGITVAQVLLTLQDSEDRRRYLNARNTLKELLKLGAVPLINENDTVATDEIRMGDNDRLAARVAAMVSADALILLSDIQGLYSADPRKDSAATLLAEVTELTPEIEAMAGGVGTTDGSGGMVTKVKAAKIATGAGSAMVIMDGRAIHPLERLRGGEACTWFLPASNPRTARKDWIAGSLKAAGALYLDAGALRALRSGKSLLPAGVTRIEGAFERGDAVIVKDPDGQEVARGLVAYSATDAAMIIGHKTSEIADRLGYRGRDEMIHRDDLVLID